MNVRRFALVLVLPATLVACDQLKGLMGKGDDAGADAAPATTETAPAATTAAPGATETAPAATTAAPLTPPGPGVKPTGPTGPGVPGVPGAPGVDAGKPGDAGAVLVTDAGAAPAPGTDGGAPVPRPQLTIPTAIPGFDAGAFKPPPGFATAIPSGLIPPQPK